VSLLKEGSAFVLGRFDFTRFHFISAFKDVGGCFPALWPGFHVPLGFCQVFIMGYSVAAGATGRLLFGYDSFGNVCGKKNSPVEGAPLSGQDMTQKK